MDLKKLIAQQISIEGSSFLEVYSLLKKSDGINGDYALPCFKFAKALKRAPNVVAMDLASALDKNGVIDHAEALNGYLNIFLNRQTVTKQIFEGGFDNQNLVDNSVGKNKTVCIDYSSINIAKPFHIGHLGTTAIGNSLYKIYSALGYKVIGINYLGDWGTQFGKLIVAYKKWGDKQKVIDEGVRALQEIYVRFHREEETNPELTEQARNWFKRIEEGDKEALKLFEFFKEVTLKEVKNVYKRLNVHFDSWDGESFFNDKMQPVIDTVKEKGLAEISDGALIVNLDKYNMPPCLLVKADGASLYATRDLAAAKYRYDTYRFDKSLYVVAYQQNLHFKQFFKVLELMGYEWANKLEHVAYGMVSLADGSMSTRKGNAVWLVDVLDKAVSKALEIIDQKSPDLAEKEEIAEKVGVGAVIFSAVSNSRIKDIVFDYDRVLNFDGETAPYLQYTHARCCSILEKAKKAERQKTDFKDLDNEESWAVIKLINDFNEILCAVTDKNEPSLLANYLIDVAQSYNKFYLAHRVIDNDVSINSRLMLTEAVKNTLCQGLSLLGIDAPEKM